MSFVTVAYVVTLSGLGALLGHAWWAMRSAERDAERVRRR